MQQCCFLVGDGCMLRRNEGIPDPDLGEPVGTTSIAISGSLRNTRGPLLSLQPP